MLMHEEARAVDRSRTVELPELTECRWLARGMIVERLRIRSHGASFSIDHSHGIRYDVEDRFELSDAASEALSQIFSLGDVDAGEKKTTCRSCRAATTSTRPLGERREGDLDESSTGTRLERDSRRDDGHSV